MNTLTDSKVLYPDANPSRDADGMACPCGGYADYQGDMTEGEVHEMQCVRGLCGRSWKCCARAFKCRVCKSRLLVNAQAPEMG